MGGEENKKSRKPEIFVRAMRVESISVKNLAEEYGVSGKSISRDIGEIKTLRLVMTERCLISKHYQAF